MRVAIAFLLVACAVPFFCGVPSSHADCSCKNPDCKQWDCTTGTSGNNGAWKELDLLCDLDADSAYQCDGEPYEFINSQVCYNLDGQDCTHGGSGLVKAFYKKEGLDILGGTTPMTKVKVYWRSDLWVEFPDWPNGSGELCTSPCTDNDQVEVKVYATWLMSLNACEKSSGRQLIGKLNVKATDCSTSTAQKLASIEGQQLSEMWLECDCDNKNMKVDVDIHLEYEVTNSSGLKLKGDTSAWVWEYDTNIVACTSGD